MAKLQDMRSRMFEAPTKGASIAECVAWAFFEGPCAEGEEGVDEEGVPGTAK